MQIYVMDINIEIDLWLHLDGVYIYIHICIWMRG